MDVARRQTRNYHSSVNCSLLQDSNKGTKTKETTHVTELMKMVFVR